MNHSIQVTRSDQPPSQRALPWVLAILFSLLWGLLAGYAFAGETPTSARGQNSGNGLTLRPVTVVYTQAEGLSFKWLRGVSVDWATGDILVADAGTNQVTLYTRDAIPLTALGYNGELVEPKRAVANGGKVYVLNGLPLGIKVFSYRGEYIGEFPMLGLAPSMKVFPTAIATDRQGSLYVGVGGDEVQILIYGPDGSLRSRLGARGTGPGKFSSIAAVAVDEAGDVYILDRVADERSVQVLDSEGRFIRAWGRRAGGPDNFSVPVGIALLADGRVAVVDEQRQTIQLYSTQGEFLGRFGGFGIRAGEVAYPTDIAADQAGRLYVTERLGQRFQILALGSATTTQGPETGPTREEIRRRIRAEVESFGLSIRRPAR